MLWTQERPLINMNNVVSIKNLTISFEAGKNVVDNVSLVSGILNPGTIFPQ